MKNKRLSVLALLSLNLLSACSTHTDEVFDLYQTVLPPVKNITRFEKSLACLDDLLVDYKGKPIPITSDGIPNHAGRDLSLLSGRDILISTISRLKNNKVFRFIVVPSSPHINLYSENMAISGGDPELMEKRMKMFARWNGGTLPKPVVYPDYKIIGSITQLDRAVVSGNASASLTYEDADLGFSRDDTTSIITVDMNVMDTADFSIVNGIGSANSIAIYRAGIAGDLGGRMKRAGVFFNFSFDRSEGVHQAIRTLIQLNTIEILGRLAKVPYETCLKLSQSST